MKRIFRYLMWFYFDRIYMPVYDFVVAQMAPYHRLQETCIQKLQLDDGDNVLCVGIGTGNEIFPILQAKPTVHIVGVDYSDNALRRTMKKAHKRGANVETRLMDVQKLDFPEASFDKALCVHVTDFTTSSGQAVSEIVRVLKNGGKFAVTFPSHKEDLSFGVSVIGEAIRYCAASGRYYRIPLVFLSAVVGTIVYLPFLFRKERREYSRHQLEEMFLPLARDRFDIEEFPAYNDYIVYGMK